MNLQINFKINLQIHFKIHLQIHFKRCSSRELGRPCWVLGAPCWVRSPCWVRTPWPSHLTPGQTGLKMQASDHGVVTVIRSPGNLPPITGSIISTAEARDDPTACHKHTHTHTHTQSQCEHVCAFSVFFMYHQ